MVLRRFSVVLVLRRFSRGSQDILGRLSGALRGLHRGFQEFLRGFSGFTQEVLRRFLTGFQMILRRFSIGCQEVNWRISAGSQAVLKGILGCS